MILRQWSDVTTLFPRKERLKAMPSQNPQEVVPAEKTTIDGLQKFFCDPAPHRNWQPFIHFWIALGGWKEGLASATYACPDHWGR
jgi:hypothetical protein